MPKLKELEERVSRLEGMIYGAIILIGSFFLFKTSIGVVNFALGADEGTLAAIAGVEFLLLGAALALVAFIGALAGIGLIIGISEVRESEEE